MTQISNQPTIKDFLLARIAEDEAAADVLPGETLGCMECGFVDGRRILAECAAKQAIVDLHSSPTYAIPAGQDDGSWEYWHNHTDLVEVRRDGHMVEQITTAEWLERVGAVLQPPAKELCALAAIYSDHPDYQQEWALDG